MTATMRLQELASLVQTMELNIELGDRNLQLEENIRQLDAQVRGIEVCNVLDMVAIGADGPPVRGYIWLKTDPGTRRKVVCAVTTDHLRQRR